MLNATSAAVSYEAAWTLVSLSSAPTAVRAAAATYTGLLNSQSDNNVKLIVLERIAELQKHHSKVLQEVLMDLLRALSSPNIDICKKVRNGGVRCGAVRCGGVRCGAERNGGARWSAARCGVLR